MKKIQVLGIVMVVAWQSIAGARTPAGGTGGRDSLGNCFDIVFQEQTNRLFVAGSAAGIHMFDVKNGQFAFVTTVADGGYYRRLALEGNTVYAADSRRGFVVLDITGKDPVCTWKQENVQGMGLSVRESHAYLAAGPEGLYIFDLSTPNTPKRVGLCKTNGVARDVWVSGQYAYVADEQQGLTVVDVASPSRARKIALAAWNTEKPLPEAVYGDGNRIYVAAGKDGLVIMDISTPRQPKLIGRYTSPEGGYAKGVAVQDDLAYLANANGANPQENGLLVLDTRDPQAVKPRSRCAFAGNVAGVCLAGHYVFIANTFSGIRCIDVTDPNRLRLAGSFGPTGESEKAEAKQVAFLDTEVSPHERQLVDYFVKTKGEVLQGRKFHDLSTPVNAFLTLLSAYQNQDPNAVAQVMPLAKQFPKLASPETGAKFLGGWGKPTVFRVEVDNKPPQESDLAAIYTSIASGSKMDQIVKFAYVQGAWRLVGGAGGANTSDALRNWRPEARQVEVMTRDILQKEAQGRR
jgi:hypothetical protein